MIMRPAAAGPSAALLRRRRRDEDGHTDGSAGTVALLTDQCCTSLLQVFLADPPGSVLYSWVTAGKLERSGSSVTEGIGQGRITDNLAGELLLCLWR